MRGWTIKGKPASGRAVLSQEQDSIKSHTHSASASSTDLGTKTTSSFDYGTKSTNNTGAHTHSLSGSTNAAGNHSHRDGRRFNPSVFKDTYQYGYTSSGQNTWGVQGSVGMSTGWLANTSTDGNHSHSLSGTAASAGAHAHTVGSQRAYCAASGCCRSGNCNGGRNLVAGSMEKVSGIAEPC